MTDLARKVAGVVMGYHIQDDPPGSGHFYYYAGDGLWLPVPDYPNDAEAVFGPGGVVERMYSRGFAFSCTRDFRYDNYTWNKEPWDVDFRSVESRNDKKAAAGYALDSSLTTAVCLAAVAAMEGGDG